MSCYLDATLRIGGSEEKEEVARGGTPGGGLGNETAGVRGVAPLPASRTALLVANAVFTCVHSKISYILCTKRRRGGRPVLAQSESRTTTVPVSGRTASTSLVSGEARTRRRLGSAEHATLAIRLNNERLAHPAATATERNSANNTLEFDFYRRINEMLIFDIMIGSSTIEIGNDIYALS